MKNHLIMLVFLLLFVSCFSQNTEDHIKKIAFDQYQKCVQQSEEPSISTFIKCTHPKILKMMGGTEKIVSVSKGEIEIKSRKILKSSQLFKEKSTFQFSFDEQSTEEYHNQKITSSATVVAISYDNGKNWYFIKAFGDIENMRRIIPELNKNLKILNSDGTNFEFKATNR